MKASKLTLIVLVLVLLVMNTWAILAPALLYYRLLRLVSTLTFLLFLSFQKEHSKKLQGVLSLLLCSDILFIFYDHPVFQAFTFILRIFTYLLVIYLIREEIRGLKTNLFQKIIFFGALSLNLFMLSALQDMIPQAFDSWILDVLFYIYGFSIIFMVIAAVSYSNRFANKASFYFMMAVLSFTFSDITSFIAYYLGFSEFYFADRLFYVAGLAGLIVFSWQDSKAGLLPDLEEL